METYKILYKNGHLEYQGKIHRYTFKIKKTHI